MYRKTVLTNGFKIVTNQMKERDSVSIGFWIGSGGRYEDDRIKGSAHFLEHILFKGSKKFSCNEIKEQIEGVGGSLNAFTAEEATCYYAKIPAKQVNRTFDVLSDIVFYPLIAKKDVDRERTVILEEIKMYQDLPQCLVLEHLDELMWPDHPLGKNLAGTIESVSGLTNKDLRDFHGCHYTADNVVLAVCGNVDHKKFASVVKRKLGEVDSGTKRQCLSAGGPQTLPRIRFFRKDIEQMHLALGMPGVSIHQEEKYILSLLNIILGGNMSSRLFNEVREKRGLAYSIGSTFKCLDDTGVFMIRAGVDNTKIVESVDVILKELKKIRARGVTQNEFSRAKDYYLGQALLGLEDTMDYMIWMGESMTMRKKIRPFSEIIALVKKIKRDDIKKLAAQIFNDSRFNLSIVGPISPKQEKGLSSLMKI